VLVTWKARAEEDKQRFIFGVATHEALFLPGAFSALDGGGVAGYMKNNTLTGA
jgi:hypothetical protein